MFAAYRTLSRWTLWTLTILAATAAAAELPTACRAPQTLLARDLQRHGEGFAGETHCYRLDLAMPGLLHLDLAVAGWLPSGARLAIFDGAGAPAGHETLERSADERLVLAPAGTYWLEITGEDPESPLPAYRLGAGFAALTKSETDGEIEIEPEELRTPCALPVKSETDGEIEIEPEELRTGCEQEPPLGERLCRDAVADDHGDTFACATAFESRIAGELGNGWGDDVDVFRFRLRRWQTVEISTDGDADTHGTLYDRAGQRLAVAGDGGEGENFRLLRTLGPGTYFVRVEGIGSTGEYRLSVREPGR